MKNYLDSDYALNRHSESIVYRFADGIVEVTREDYLAKYPDKTEADFLKLKEESDAIYKEQDRNEYQQTWKNTAIDAVSESIQCVSPSTEEILFDLPEEAARQQKKEKCRREQLKIASNMLDKLTAIQRRRYLQHVVEGLTTREIAQKEGVSHVAVVYSLEYAEKKIKKFFLGIKND